MRLKEIEIGREYAARHPSRHGYWQTRAARVKILVVGVYGRKSKDYWGGGSGRSAAENYILVEDLSDSHQDEVEGEYGPESPESESAIRWGLEVTPGTDKRMNGYYSKLLAALPRPHPTLTSGARICTVQASWILEPWEEFAPKAGIRRKVKAAEEGAEKERQAEEVVEQLHAVGVKSAQEDLHGGVCGVWISYKDAAGLAIILRELSKQLGAAKLEEAEEAALKTARAMDCESCKPRPQP